jgi:DNA-directed RNA polymerases I, II, and III subunit RPABC2
MSDLEGSDNELENELSEEENELSEEEIIDQEFSTKEKFKVKPIETTLNLNTEDDEDIEEDDDDDEDGEAIYNEGEDVENNFAEDKVEPSNKLMTLGPHSVFTIDNNIELPDNIEKNDSDYESGDDESEDDDYLQKLDNEIKENIIARNHPESQMHNYDEIYKLTKVNRDKNNIIVDLLHKTNPILTKYEKTRILGLRAKQINNGAKPYIQIEKNIIDGYLIAVKELEEKKLPFIVRRPMPNGGSEYWKLKDLEIVN